jgi:hypothetical protein
VAVAPVPASYSLGRRVKPTSIRAADVDDSNTPESSTTQGQSNVPTQSLGQHNVPTTQSLGQHNVPTANPLDIHRIGMATQTLSTATAASALVGTQAPGRVHQFLQPKKNTGKTAGTPGAGASGGPPGSGPPAGSGPPHAPGPPGGGGAGGGGGAAGGGGGGNGRLGGNLPEEFDGERSKTNAFMNQFNLYRLSNYDAEAMVVPCHDI